ncbi:hypothetical protein Ppb6_03965 [Photorhabdus australis subsp. thailandensis]|uniref:Uncharacterized protein n=1 Tax=Photorhabdus australis subsp. thailandensis TaxID=2805096 RepID=A0A1C0TYX0_9GAMM|nr:hypothetical protein Ppb6_03965 [Photorhabdus australis subsp. thailandensis]
MNIIGISANFHDSSCASLPIFEMAAREFSLIKASNDLFTGQAIETIYIFI